MSLPSGSPIGSFSRRPRRLGPVYRAAPDRLCYATNHADRRRPATPPQMRACGCMQAVVRCLCRSEWVRHPSCRAVTGRSGGPSARKSQRLRAGIPPHRGPTRLSSRPDQSLCVVDPQRPSAGLGQVHFAIDQGREPWPNVCKALFASISAFAHG
jgi:hypothetical protein